VTAPRLLLLGLLLAHAAPPAHPKDPPEPRPGVERLVTRTDGGRLLVSFALVNAISAETLERIHSGLPVTFWHSVEVTRSRTVPLWPARVLAEAKIVTSVDYDSLTRQYTLARTLELRRAKELTSTDTERSTDSVETMRAWMTELPEIEMLDLGEADEFARVRVRVESALQRYYVFFIFPTRLTVSAEHRLGP